MEKEERIEVKKIKFLKDDPYFNYVSVKLTNGEKFLVMGEIDKFGRFHVKRKRGSILPYYVEIGSDEEQDEAYDYYLQKKLIVTRKVKTFECYLLEENYENAIADANKTPATPRGLAIKHDSTRLITAVTTIIYFVCWYNPVASR